MKTRNSFILAFAVLIAACVTGPDVRVSMDPFADFDGYRTFGFMQPLGTDRNGTRTLLSGHLMEATTRELMNRGLTLDNTNPDIRVNFLSSSQTGIRTANQPVSAMALRGYGAWSNYRTGPSTMSDITEGAVSIDLVDSRTNLLVWEGVARDRVTESTSDNMRAVIGEAVARMFEDFPRS